MNSIFTLLVGVCILFFVCWAPFHAQRLLARDGYGEETEVSASSPYLILYFVVGLLYYACAPLTPLLMSLLSPRFRKAFICVLRLRCSSSYLTTFSGSNQRRRALFPPAIAVSFHQCGNQSNHSMYKITPMSRPRPPMHFDNSWAGIEGKMVIQKRPPDIRSLILQHNFLIVLRATDVDYNSVYFAAGLVLALFAVPCLSLSTNGAVSFVLFLYFRHSSGA